jgi:hypothetical protein
VRGAQRTREIVDLIESAPPLTPWVKGHRHQGIGAVEDVGCM